MRELFGSLRDARSRFQLLNGAPDLRVDVGQRDPRSGPGARCSGLVVPTEVWGYARNARTGEQLLVIFYRPGGVADFRRWHADEGLAALLVTPGCCKAEARRR